MGVYLHFISEENTAFCLSLIVKSMIIIEIMHRVLRKIIFDSESHRVGTGGIVCKSVPNDQLAKTAAQITHLLVNCVLCCTGVYYWFISGIVPKYEDTTLEERWTGYENHAFFGCILIAYNTWSSYVGWLVWGGEDTIMTLHHVLASTAGFVSCFTTYGWRYYAPFFYGTIEISSLPLSIMNAFKVRPDWCDLYPTFHEICKVFFAVSFLWARIALWIPNVINILQDNKEVIINQVESVNATLRVVTLLTTTLPAILLTGLQLFWGWLIIEEISKLLIKKDDKTTKKHT